MVCKRKFRENAWYCKILQGNDINIHVLNFMFIIEPCITDNDGCQHICFVEGESSQCACHVGYTLQSDRKSCLSGIQN